MASLNLADMMSRTSPMAEKKKTKWIQGAVKHPGRETRRAKEHGVSVHQQLETDSHSSNRSLRAAGNLGLRFEGHKGGIQGKEPHKKSRRKTLYDHPRSASRG
jgi:hypothetical protein